MEVKQLSFIDFQLGHLENGKNSIEESIKILLFKENENIFDQIDFDDSRIYAEPMLFSYFNFKEVEHLEHLLVGYKQNASVLIRTDKYKRKYIPGFGWIKSQTANETVELQFKNGELIKSSAIEIEPPYVIQDEIELYPYPVSILGGCFYDEHKKLIEVEVENVAQKYLRHLEKAYRLIKEFVPAHYNLIKTYAPKCVVFSDKTGRRNSFADFAAHGVGFYNAYQETYDEVFFVDDIAHQTGHVLMSTMAKDISVFIKIDPLTVIDEIGGASGVVETRHIEIVFHALYTYYTVFVCLNACLDNEVFDEKKKLEALGRMKFYVAKCQYDLRLFKPFGLRFNELESGLFTPDGHRMMNTFFRTWFNMKEKWKTEFERLDLSNQPYNFTNKLFFELNDLA